MKNCSYKGKDEVGAGACKDHRAALRSRSTLARFSWAQLKRRDVLAGLSL